MKAKLRGDRIEPTNTTQDGAMDFVHDQLATGRKLHALTTLDTDLLYSPETALGFS